MHVDLWTVGHSIESSFWLESDGGWYRDPLLKRLLRHLLRNRAGETPNRYRDFGSVPVSRHGVGVVYWVPWLQVSTSQVWDVSSTYKDPGFLIDLFNKHSHSLLNWEPFRIFCRKEGQRSPEGFFSLSNLKRVETPTDAWGWGTPWVPTPGSRVLVPSLVRPSRLVW